MPSVPEVMLHFINNFWKLVFSMTIIPGHSDGFGGWLSFGMSLVSFVHLCYLCRTRSITSVQVSIVGICFLLGEIATLWGCVVGLSPYLTGMTIVALGSTIPDTLASVIAARNAETADAAIGNVLGSTSSNVFLGIGIPWLISSSYCAATGKCAEVAGGPRNSSKFSTDSPGFVPSVTFFSMFATLTLILLAVRRFKVGAELGGPMNTRWGSSAFLLAMWLTFLLLMGFNVNI